MSTNEKDSKPEKEAKSRKDRTVHSAHKKCQAVLSLWTGSRRPSEVCREMSVPANLLQTWQERAMEGMLKALEPRTRRQEDRGPILGDRLQRMLERKALTLGNRMARMTGNSKPPKGAQEKPPANAN